MNIVQQQKALETLSDQELLKEAKAPTGQVPQFLVISEVQRRKDFRSRYAAMNAQQEAQQPPVAQRAIAEFEGIAGADPNAANANQPMAGEYSDAPQAANIAPGGIGSLPTQGMKAGGVVRRFEGGGTIKTADGKTLTLPPAAAHWTEMQKARWIAGMTTPAARDALIFQTAPGGYGYDKPVGITPTGSAAAPVAPSVLSQLPSAQAPQVGADTRAAPQQETLNLPDWVDVAPRKIAARDVPYDQYREELSGILSVDPEARERERHALALTQLGSAIANAAKPGMIAAALPGITTGLMDSRRQEMQDKVAKTKAMLDLDVAQRADQMAMNTATREEAVLAATREQVRNLFEMNRAALEVRAREASNTADRNRLMLLLKMMSDPSTFADPKAMEQARSMIAAELAMMSPTVASAAGQTITLDDL